MLAIDEVGKGNEDEAESIPTEEELEDPEADDAPVGNAVFKLEAVGNNADNKSDADGAEEGPPIGRDNPNRPESPLLVVSAL